jgi:carbamoyltransferase
MKILGINYSHNATVAVLEDNKIVFCVSEERLNRLKNSFGFPSEAVKLAFEKFGNFDFIVLNSHLASTFKELEKFNFKPIRYIDHIPKIISLDIKTFLRFVLWKLNKNLYGKIFEFRHKMNLFSNNKKSDFEKIYSFIKKEYNIDRDKVILLDHHTAHAFSPAFNFELNKKFLVFTSDGEGDGISSTVSIIKNGEIEILYKSSVYNSIGGLWFNLTAFMGLKPLEDEYKIMGLAPYSKIDKALKVAEKFKKSISLNENGKFEHKMIPAGSAPFFIFDNFLMERFDNLAGGIQLFTEEIICNWIKYWINKTGIHDIALSGGLFMNVKLNQRISELKEVENIFIMPSAGDESAAIGCCFYGYKKYCEENNLPFNPQPFTHLYLGLEYSNEDIKKTIKDLKLESKYKVKFYEDIEKEVAKLLAQNEIVARFSGAMEFGARALGNRSILSNPSNYDNVRIINEMIKQRDFWMPFACSILEEDQHEYIENPKNIYAPYMIITFNTAERGRKELKAGIHPYDFTIRPQIVRKEWNPKYHYLISEFKKLTGIGGVLNTSFNLHGEPLVCSPEDAISTFERSGLKYLALGNYLISKNE